MTHSYDFFAGKEKLTIDDIVDFEAHADLMQDRDLADIEKECHSEIKTNQILEVKNGYRYHFSAKR